jgi:hypothetical protein
MIAGGDRCIHEERCQIDEHGLELLRRIFKVCGESAPLARQNVEGPTRLPGESEQARTHGRGDVGRRFSHRR